MLAGGTAGWQLGESVAGTAAAGRGVGGLLVRAVRTGFRARTGLHGPRRSPRGLASRAEPSFRESCSYSGHLQSVPETESKRGKQPDLGDEALNGVRGTEQHV